jgi:tetratricopeptide (TPR) repeat protein
MLEGEYSMKRTLSLCLGLFALAFLPAVAQQPAPAAGATGKIHGQVLNPTGQPQGNGTVTVSTDGQASKLDIPVGPDGSFSGEIAPGTYFLIYRQPDTPKGQMVDEIRGVKVAAGEDTAANIDMSRPEFLEKMSPEQRKQLEEIKKSNAEALKANNVINHLNADLKAVGADKHDIDVAGQTAQQQLGATASKADIEGKANEIKTAKYTDIESMMTRDTEAKADEAILWTNLAFAQFGLKKNDEAIANYKKALDLETASKKPRGEVIGAANAGLGEIYARTGKADDANKAYDAAAAADPQRAPVYLKNEAIIFFQQGNADAQSAAADKAIAASPSDALLYYIKGQALVQKATVDPKTNRIVLPDDCTAAYQKYLELAPQGQFAGEVAGILQQAGQKVGSSFKAPPAKK